MPIKTSNNPRAFKVDDYEKVVNLMKQRKAFKGKPLSDIAIELDIPKPRVYRYKDKYVKELSQVLPEKEVEEITTPEPTKMELIPEEDIDKFVEELDKLTKFKWDGMEFIIHCIAEFKAVVSDKKTSLTDKIKLFNLIAPYIATKVPEPIINNQEGQSLTVANIYTQAQQFYQQQNFISNETDQNPKQRNKKK